MKKVFNIHVLLEEVCKINRKNTTEFWCIYVYLLELSNVGYTCAYQAHGI